MPNNDETTEEMIQAKGLTAPRVTKEIINSKIIREEVIEIFTSSGAKIYIGLYAMRNGFTVSGKPIVIEGETDKPYPNDMRTGIITHKTLSGSILRFGYLEIPSGLVIIGRPSASVSAENDNEEIGVKIATENCNADRLMGYAINPMDSMPSDEAKTLALKNAYSEIWAFEGYLLATTLTDTHLCTSCKYDFATCEAKEIGYGNGVGNDNVVSCPIYSQK